MHEQLCREAVTLMRAKNHDYSGGKDASDPFLNFTRVERLGITDTKTGFMVRMTDKISRLITFIQNGSFKTKDEALKDTILDLINYSILLYAYAQTEKDDYTE
tara:strand:+ start:230 stop:538 length:309 start_codon:yes stop_codon:yes gene_type:complete